MSYIQLDGFQCFKYCYSQRSEEVFPLLETYERLMRQLENLTPKNHSKLFFLITFLGLPELREKKSMVDHSKPLPASLQNEFIPEEVLLSLTSAAFAGPCPENLLPPKKIKTPKVCTYICKVLRNIYPFDIQFIMYVLSICYIFQIVLKFLKIN